MLVRTSSILLQFPLHTQWSCSIPLSIRSHMLWLTNDSERRWRRWCAAVQAVLHQESMLRGNHKTLRWLEMANNPPERHSRNMLCRLISLKPIPAQTDFIEPLWGSSPFFKVASSELVHNIISLYSRNIFVIWPTSQKLSQNLDGISHPILLVCLQLPSD